MKVEDFDFKKLLKKTSSRHHYIPKFLINGFVNSDGLLYVYNKTEDKILSKPKPPKSIFFETDRNTIQVDDVTQSSFIEDYLYADIDNRSSKAVRHFQSEPISNIDFKMEDTATLLFFLITLFWRIPKTDYAAEDVLKRSVITTKGIDPEVFRNDPTYKKLNRASLFAHHIEELKKFGGKGKSWSNIHESFEPIYVIGDYPFLFRDEPNTFRGFYDSDLLFAINSRRMYSATKKGLDSFSLRNSLAYNSLIIHQSVKYIACGSLDFLKLSIDFYKRLKSDGLIFFTDSAFS